MFFKVFFLLLFITLQAEPWGKDADLVFSHSIQLKPKKSIGVTLSNLLIRFHQNVISPADGPRSHYYPSSSQYTLEAINQYGFFTGWMLGCDRLLRENSDKWVYKDIVAEDGTLLKWDPTP